MRRRAALEDLLAGTEIGPPIRAVPTTADSSLARVCYEGLQQQGVEGLVVKVDSSVYGGGSRQWRKVRHAETIGAAVIGYTGSAARPRHWAVRLPDGRTALSQPVTGVLAAQVAPHLVAAERTRRAGTDGGEGYLQVEVDVLVEVLAGTTRHAVVTVTRVR